MSYDGTSTFRMDVTVENLTAQALGTADGATPSPDGVRVFFHADPVATSGEGPVAVQNADGEGVFMAPGQKYFRYDGILPAGDTSAAREWRFTLPGTVTSFGFTVYVAAPVRAEAGWISMSPIAPSVAIGDTIGIAATVRTMTGSTGGGVVAWTTADPAIATVDAQGRVTGVAPGTATITATSGSRTGSVKVYVFGNGYSFGSTITRLEVRNASPVANGDSVVFQAKDRDTDILRMEVELRHPAGGTRTCTASGPIQTDSGGTWHCAIRFGEGWREGAWRVERVRVSSRSITYAELLAAGAPAHVYLTSPNQDLTAPTVESLSILTDTVVAGSAFEMRVWVADDKLGVQELRARIGSTGNPAHVLPGNPIQFAAGRTLYQVRYVVPQYFHPGTFRLDSVWVYDANRNRRRLTRAELATAGFETEFIVTGGTPDVTPPSFTGFSFTPLTVTGNGTDTVTVTLSAQEPLSESGVWFLDMEFQKLSDETQRRRCLLNGSTLVHTRTMTCKLVFGPGDTGGWWVRYVRAIDFMNNARELDYAQIQAAGYPVDLTVQSAEPDTTGPRIAAFSFSPQTVIGNGADSISMSFTATEPENEAGVWFMDVVFEKVSNTSEFRRCLVNDDGVVFSRTLACRQAFTAADAGEWRVRYIRAIDFMDNTRLLRTAALQAAGYPTQLIVTAP